MRTVFIAAAICLQASVVGANGIAKVATVVKSEQQTPRGGKLSATLVTRERVRRPRTQLYSQKHEIEIAYADHQNVFDGKPTLTLGGDVSTVNETWHHAAAYRRGEGRPSTSPWKPVREPAVDNPIQAQLERGEDGVYRGTIHFNTGGVYKQAGRIISGVHLAVGDDQTYDSTGYRGNTHLSFTK